MIDFMELAIQNQDFVGDLDVVAVEPIDEAIASSNAAEAAYNRLMLADDADDAARDLARMLSRSEYLPAAHRRAFAAAALLINRHDWQPRRHNRIA